MLGLMRIRKLVVSSRGLRLLFLLWLLPLLGAVPAAGAELDKFLPGLDVGQLVPGADRLGPVEGTPPAARAFAGDKPLGYVLLNADAVNAVGYSGKPIRIAVGLGLDGTITGAKLLEHHEPIVLVGIPEERIRAYIARYAGRNVVREAATTAASSGPVDVVSGATVTVMVIDDTIRRSALKVARSRGLGSLVAPAQGTPAKPELDTAAAPQQEDWQTLLGDGSVRRLTLTVGEVSDAFARAGHPEAAALPEAQDPNAAFIDLYVALATVPTVGQSLLGPAEYGNLEARLQPGEQAILVAGAGLYSFKGSGYVRGGIFDRFQLVQDETSVRFRDRQHTRVGAIAAAGAPELPDVDLFRIPADAGFDPAQPWRLQLLVQRATGARDKAFISVDLPYSPPEKYLIKPPPPLPAQAVAAPPQPDVAGPGLASVGQPSERDELWRRIWQAKSVEIGVTAVAIGVLTAALVLLTGLFFFQDWFVRRPRLTTWVRYGFLAFTLVWLGWYANAQLSVVNVLTFSNALLSDFSWSYFLMDPLIFVLWFSVAAGLLFWARGAFCGWLCPFGALQELTNHAGRRLGIRQVTLPWGLHERLWPLKYMVFLGLFGVSLYSLSLGERLAEVEPFKTAIILKFWRSWPFVLYAVGLLTANLFVERFFCRYLCPLGAALAIPARLRMFEWLKRWPECGSPCQRCANDCPVSCIHPDGHINVNECIYCLECQKLYYDDHRCPHVIKVRLKREQRLLTASESMLTPAQLAEKRRLEALQAKPKPRPKPAVAPPA